MCARFNRRSRQNEGMQLICVYECVRTLTVGVGVESRFALFTSGTLKLWFTQTTTGRIAAFRQRADSTATTHCTETHYHPTIRCINLCYYVSVNISLINLYVLTAGGCNDSKVRPNCDSPPPPTCCHRSITASSFTFILNRTHVDMSEHFNFLLFAVCLVPKKL